MAVPSRRADDEVGQFQLEGQSIEEDISGVGAEVG